MRQSAVRCVEVVESVTDWMEGALEDADRLELEEHLVICPHCVEYVAELRLTTSLLRESEVIHEARSPAILDALLEAFRRQHGR